MAVGAKVVLFGKTLAEVVGVSANGKRIQVAYADKVTWTATANAATYRKGA